MRREAIEAPLGSQRWTPLCKAPHSGVHFSPKPNEAPTVSITAPADGSSVVEGTSIDFIGTATDPEDGDLAASITWSSNLDNALGTGATVSAALSVGTHTVTASVTDADGSEASTTVNVTVTASPSPPGKIVAPTVGSVLGESVTFEWSPSASDIQRYILNLGSVAGGGDIYSSGWVTDVTSLLVSDIPQSAAPIYVRLSSFLDDVWVYEDYAYQMGGVAEPGRLITPVPLSTVSDTATFEWTPSTNHGQLYILNLGSVPGGGDIYSSGWVENATSHVVSGIPQSGAALYARLSSYLNNDWVFEDYEFQMGGAAEPGRLIAPVALSTVSETATFEWTPSTNHGQLYILNLGSVPGGGDICSSGWVENATSHTVSGIPQTGEDIYIRLWSYLNNEWIFEDAVYQTGN